MWILPKPDIADAINDIAMVIANSDGALYEGDRSVLAYLYRAYDEAGGVISKADNDRLSGAKQNTLHSLYRKTQQGGKLYYIREALFKLTDVCPMCGINEPSQLDHQMPRADWKSLSVCRMNLVPTCGICNNKKRKGESTNFVHAYYDHALSNIPFFVIEIHSSPITHRMSWKYSINKRILGNQVLADKIENQVQVVKLFRRLYKETNIYLSDFLYGAGRWSEQVLEVMLQAEYEKQNQQRGMNDWHTVMIKALIDSDRFGLAEAQEYARRIKPLNGGTNG